MAELFATANTMDTASDADRNALKKCIRDIVGYACKIACEPNNGNVDIYVYSNAARRVTDWIEMQPSGAVGAIFDMYDDPDITCDDACGAYNDRLSLIFEDSDEDSSVSTGST
jgi:hypothetical protein